MGVGLLCFDNSNYQEVKAASNADVLFKDNFDDNGGLNNNWENDGATLTNDGYSLRIHPEKYIWGDFLGLNAFYLDKNTKIEFNVRCLDAKGAWLAFGVGVDNPTYRFHDCQYAFIFCQDITTTLKNDGSTLAANSTSFSYSPFGQSRIDIYHKVVLEFNKTTDGYNYNYSVYKASDNSLVGSTSNIALGDISGYVGFSNSLCNCEISSITISQADEVVFADDFTNYSISYADNPMDTANWYSNGFKKSDVSYGRYGKLDLTKPNTGIKYINELVNNNDGMIDKSYQIDMDVHYIHMSDQTLIGIELTNASNETHFFGLRKEVVGYALVHYSNNQLIKEQVIATDSVNGVVNLSLSIYTSNQIVLSNGNISISDTISFAKGKISLYSRSNDNTAICGYIDNFVIEKDVYIKSNANDAQINFNGTKTTRYDEREMHEFFINLKEWNLGENVKVTPYTTKSKDNGFLMFSNSTVNSAFSPTSKYTDYIMRFDVTVTSSTNLPSAAIGMEFAKHKFNDFYGNIPSLGILYSGGQSAVTCASSTLDPSYSTELRDSSNQPVNYFTGGTINFLFVVKDNQVEMHLKRADEPESELSKIKAIAKVSSTFGYPAVFGVNGVSFTLDNVSITNLDYELTSSAYAGKDNQETARNDFATDTKLKGFATNNAGIANKKLTISNGGTVTSLKPLQDNIVRFKVADISNSLTVKQGDVTFTINNGATPSYDVVDGINYYHRDLDGFALANSIFELRFTSDNLEVRYVSGNSPLYNINNNVYNYLVFTNPDNIVISSNGESSLSTLALFNIDSHITIANRDYDETIDYYDPWPVRPSDQDAKKGVNLGLILGISIPAGVLLIGGVVFIIIFIRRRKKAHEAQ